MAARLARAAGLVHPMDWVRVYKSHTPHEWAMQKSLMIVDPWGDKRADLRSAMNSVQVIASTSVTTPEESWLMRMLRALTGYTPANREESETVGPGAIRQALGE